MSSGAAILDEVVTALSAVSGLKRSRRGYDRFPGGGQLDEGGSFAVGVLDSAAQADGRQQDARGLLMATGVNVKLLTALDPGDQAGGIAAHLALEPLALGALMAVRDEGGAPALRVERIQRAQQGDHGELYLTTITCSCTHLFPVTRP